MSTENERRALLETLAERLPERGLQGRMLGGAEPVLWIWHPRTSRQTIVLATQSGGGWLFLWSPDGQENADDPEVAADTLEKLLSQAA
ncbi:hypothetical protein [Herbidospora mongoliensis]|uniref:hypothetical protein n=1 Tax=Herbidospora mongoliensis TaxID=688067 RepID=UPI00082D1B46|nr:hypothetical protein [Herbidospora mongoliensis]